MRHLSKDSDHPRLRDEPSITTTLPGAEGNVEAQRGENPSLMTEPGSSQPPSLPRAASWLWGECLPPPPL